MNIPLNFLLFLIWNVCVFLTQAKEWIVLVVGSKDWENARHTADICHAYHIVHNHSIPDEQIIVMMYDNVANDPQNPYPGQLFNAPTADSIPGIDVYKNCPKDYVGENVTAEKFLAVLTGNKEVAKGKVLQSTLNDTVFIYYSDHGGSDLLCFPSGPYLYAEELMQTFQTMYEKQLYGNMTVYVEACEAGSMFKNLPPNISIFVTTASNAIEPSFAYYCPPNDYVQGVPIGTCLGDEYSIRWLQDDDRHMNLTETFEQQFLRIKKQVSTSHVSEFGQFQISRQEIKNFLGEDLVAVKDDNNMLPTSIKEESLLPLDKNTQSAISSYDVALHLMYYRYLRARQADNKEVRMAYALQLKQKVEHQIVVDQYFIELNNMFRIYKQKEGTMFSYELADLRQELESIDSHTLVPCYSKLQETYTSFCGPLDSYTLQYLHVFPTICKKNSILPLPLPVLSHLVERLCIKVFHTNDKQNF